MRTMTINETREISGGWKVTCPQCGKKVKVGFFAWLLSGTTKTDLMNYHSFGIGKKH